MVKENLPPTAGQTKSEETKKANFEFVDEPKLRKKREKPVVRIYEKASQPNQPELWKPVLKKVDPPVSAPLPVQFESTQEAVVWCKKNLAADKRYQIVTVQREFTMKAKQVVKLTME